MKLKPKYSTDNPKYPKRGEVWWVRDLTWKGVRKSRPVIVCSYGGGYCMGMVVSTKLPEGEDYLWISDREEAGLSRFSYARGDYVRVQRDSMGYKLGELSCEDRERFERYCKV